ncbi:MAG: hypothetical protein NC035_08930 [Bacteroides sp.]|nr:hypothetical protein [Bacteroides sp.]
MPNWCDTQYTITGEIEKVKKLHELIAKLDKQTIGDLWLGTISNELGGSEDDQARGWIYYTNIEKLSSNEAEFTIECNTAWGEPDNWRRFIERTADVNVTYIAIEPGCEVYLTNNPDYIDSYILDDDIDGLSYPHTEHEVIDMINENYQQQFSTIQDCYDFAEQFNQENRDNGKYLFIHQFEEGE